MEATLDRPGSLGTGESVNLSLQECKSLTEPPEIAAIRVASDLVKARPDWITFFREILGVDGMLRKLYPTKAALSAFEQTAEYGELMRMLARLRAAGDQDDGTEVECQRVITLRIPKSLHAALKADASLGQTSMNQLCIDRLLRVEPVEQD